MSDTASESRRNARVLCLLSGGLDSLLAVKILLDQQAEVTGLSFESPFFNAAAARAAAAQLGIALRVEDFTAEIMRLLDNPPHGFGSRMNPCVDCHAAMIRLAGEIMAREGYDAVATGEVMGERPFSQNPQALALVAKLSGIPDRLLRPLSARLLPETLPETQGLIRRDRLLGLRGRSRLPQLRLAEQYGLKDFPTPAGGCKLTDPHFTVRLKELKDRGELFDTRAVRLLTIGRHFRLPDGSKLVVGRNESENRAIEAAAGPSDVVFAAADAPGASAMLPAGVAEDIRLLAAAICACHSDAPRDAETGVTVASASGMTTVRVIPAARPVVDGYRVDKLPAKQRKPRKR